MKQLTLRIQMINTFRDFLMQDAREKVLYGGAGSGKTVAAQQYALAKGMKEPNQQTLIVMETRPGNLSSMFYPMCRMLEASRIPYRSRETAPMHITLPNGHVIWFTSADKDEKMKYWDNISRIIINEATALTAADFQQLISRVGRTTNAETIFTFNPIDENHWLCKEYVIPFLNDSPEPDVIVHHSTYKDNKFLTPEWCKWLEERVHTDPNFHRVYALGLPGHLEGLVYQEGVNWVRVPLGDFPFELRKFPPNVVGLDWGVSDPTAAVAVWEHQGKRYAHCIFYRTQATGTDVDSFLKHFCEQYFWPKDIALVGDPSGASYIEEMVRRGWKVHKADNSILYGISQVKDKQIIISDESVDLIKEIRNYHWKKKDGEMVDEPLDTMNHALDALRYAVCKLSESKTTRYKDIREKIFVW